MTQLNSAGPSNCQRPALASRQQTLIGQMRQPVRRESAAISMVTRVPQKYAPPLYRHMVSKAERVVKQQVTKIRLVESSSPTNYHCFLYRTDHCTLTVFKSQATVCLFIFKRTAG